MINISTFRKLLFIFIFISSTVFLSHAGIVVLNGLTHEKTLQPGENNKGTIQIQNTGDTEKGVKVYLRDYSYSFTGESKHPDPGTLERSNANWVKFNPELITLGPKETATIEFEVSVPDNDSLIGTYWSVLMLEGIITPDTTNLDKGVTINTAIRYAVQIITNIEDTGTSDVKFLGLDLGQQADNNILNVFIENTGERMLRPQLAVELFDKSGNSAGVIKADRRKIYPGTSVTITLVLKGMKPGGYTGVLVADCDEDHIFGTNVSFDLQ